MREPPVPRPVSGTTAVRQLCEDLVPGGIPVLLKIDAPPWATPDNCTGNVESVIELHGGSAEYGWQLWESVPELLLDAEFHAVWLDSNGDRHDVTPKGLQSLTHAVFLPDPNLVYEGRQIDNVRRNLTDDPLIDELIETAEAYFEVTNRGELADVHGYIAKTPEMQMIQKRRQRLEMKIFEKYFL